MNYKEELYNIIIGQTYGQDITALHRRIENLIQSLLEQQKKELIKELLEEGVKDREKYNYDSDERGHNEANNLWRELLNSKLK